MWCSKICFRLKYYFILYNKAERYNTFRCSKYKTIEKCKAFIQINNEGKNLKIDGKHNHGGNIQEINKRRLESQIKEDIKSSPTPFLFS